MFGDNLKRERERCGISQVQFAELIGVSQPMVAQYELNTKIPSVIIAVNMEKVLNVSCRELVEERSNCMNEVTNWTFGETEVRTIERDGKPWWVLKDVCAVLEIKNHKEIPDRLESDEVGRFELPHPQNHEKQLK